MAAPHRLTAGAGDPGVETVRSFRAADIPEVVALRRRVFRYSERNTDAALTEYFERMFCRPRSAVDGLPSLVHVDGQGRVLGFLGVFPRQMRFRDERILVAVATQLMVAPESRGLAGRALVRAFLRGPQDLSFSDTANDAARRLWVSLGANVSPAPSLSWTQVLRPWRHLGAEASHDGAGLVVRAALYAARPLLSVADLLLTRRPSARPVALTEPFDPTRVAAVAEDVLGGYGLRPVYDAETLAWLLAQAAEKREYGTLDGRIVRGDDGSVAGWFLYYRNRTGMSQVLQVAAQPRDRGLVLDAMLEHARQHGVVALAGPLDPGTIHEAAIRRSTLRHEGPWVLFSSQRRDLMQAIAGGDAYLSRLEGEWWMSF
ncbi:MAG TPA: GNAT family N-acetyltransferase [Gemmatimonadales bacterium]|nr:GNAT family N-acetyltransferase [Gemmatimonadales bacterium]